MYHAVKGLPTECARDLLHPAEHELGTVGDGITMSRRKVIDDCDCVPGPKEPGRDNASDIAGTACDEHVHVVSPEHPEPARRVDGPPCVSTGARQRGAAGPRCPHRVDTSYCRDCRS